MTEQLLICTDLDRTLIPNGPQSESPNARGHFAAFVAHLGVTLAYVTGRHRALVEQAIVYYRLPLPDFVIGDVGTTIYHLGPKKEWTRQAQWEAEIARDWGRALVAQELQGGAGAATPISSPCWSTCTTCGCKKRPSRTTTN